jgi:hypothetical protein
MRVLSDYSSIPAKLMLMVVIVVDGHPYYMQQGPRMRVLSNYSSIPAKLMLMVGI